MIVLLRLGCGILGVSVALLAVCDPPRVTVGNRSSVGDLVVVSVRRPLKERLSVNLRDAEGGHGNAAGHTSCGAP